MAHSDTQYGFNLIDGEGVHDQIDCGAKRIGKEIVTPPKLARHFANKRTAFGEIRKRIYNDDEEGETTMITIDAGR